MMNRPLSKLAYAEEFEGDASPRTAAYYSVREEQSTAITYKLPTEVEFRKRSNKNLFAKCLLARSRFAVTRQPKSILTCGLLRWLRLLAMTVFISQRHVIARSHFSGNVAIHKNV
ncbi:MAG: palindromic element RPE1 domain-containing protein [Rickettsia endosymbiont of Labidopullus appendiculatus]|nr:palindromic element RPE1 domain-containing protein [Rickettsia endosymbiont of Labidopullus appendiculatus]